MNQYPKYMCVSSVCFRVCKWTHFCEVKWTLSPARCVEDWIRWFGWGLPLLGGTRMKSYGGKREVKQHLTGIFRHYELFQTRFHSRQSQQISQQIQTFQNPSAQRFTRFRGFSHLFYNPELWNLPLCLIFVLINVFNLYSCTEMLNQNAPSSVQKYTLSRTSMCFKYTVQYCILGGVYSWQACETVHYTPSSVLFQLCVHWLTRFQTKFPSPSKLFFLGNVYLCMWRSLTCYTGRSLQCTGHHGNGRDDWQGRWRLLACACKEKQFC